MTTVNGDGSRTTDVTRLGIVFSIIVVLIRTTTGTINIAAIGVICASIRNVIRRIFWSAIIIGNWRTFSNTYHTTMDSQRSILINMAILTTTIDRTFDMWTCHVRALTFGANHDVGAINPCYIVVDGFWSAHITARGTKDHTIIMTIHANGTSCDSDGCRTTRGVTIDGCTISLAGIAIGTHRTVGTATIYIMVDRR